MILRVDAIKTSYVELSTWIVERSLIVDEMKLDMDYDAFVLFIRLSSIATMPK